jgi:hypothetical protein
MKEKMARENAPYYAALEAASRPPPPVVQEEVAEVEAVFAKVSEEWRGYE